MKYHIRPLTSSAVCPFVLPFPGFDPADQGQVSEHDRLVFEVKPGWSTFLRKPFRVERERAGIGSDDELVFVTKHGPHIRSRRPVRGREVFGEGAA